MAYDLYGNLEVPPDGSGYEDENFDGEGLVSFLIEEELGG